MCLCKVLGHCETPKDAHWHRFYKSLQLYWSDERYSSKYIPSVGVLMRVVESANTLLQNLQQKCFIIEWWKYFDWKYIDEDDQLD